MTDPRARVITEPLGGSALSQAVQTRALAAGLQPWWPSTVGEWREHVERVRAAGDVNWLHALRPALSASGAAADRLERAAGGKGIVITTGQQAGLFGGPIYTLAKALSALGLADTLERQIGVPVAPVFWAATDDADFLEASVTYAANADGLVELRATGGPPPGTPMSSASLSDTGALLDKLRQACGSAAHAAFFDIARDAYTGRRTVGGAYVDLLRALLQPLGIAVMDSSHAAYHTASRPMLLRALERASDIARAASARAAAIRQSGFRPQVEDDRGLSLVFASENGVKRRLSTNEARAVGQRGASDTTLTPNVLLRPVVERSLFPTAAYVAGPGELAYLAQVSAVSEVLGGEPVVGVPRWSCTVVEPFTDRALRRLNVDAHEVRDLHALERRLATGALPIDVSASWARLQERLSGALREVGDAVRDSALMPPTVIEGLERSLAHRLGRAERRIVAAAKRRDTRVRHDLAVVSGALYPLGQRQERVLNFIPMLARNGESLLHSMRDAATAYAGSLVAAERAETLTVR